MTTSDAGELRRFAEGVVRRLRDAGHQALFAGGCVRDLLLNARPKDYDVATSARPEQVQSLFRRTTAVGVSFGVVQVRGAGNLAVEVATFRADGDYSDGRRPDNVRFSDAREDALRRDFTINGMFFDPVDDELLDFVGGREDLAAKVIRAVGEPTRRFEEDKLRLVRAARFAARFDFTIESATLAAVQRMAPRLVVVSGERILAELRQMMERPSRGRGLELLAETGLAAVAFAEIVDAVGLAEAAERLRSLSDQAPFALCIATVYDALSGPDAEAAAERFFDRFKGANADRDLCRWLLRRRDDLAGAAERPLSFRKRLYADPRWPLLAELGRVRGVADDVDECERERASLPEAEIAPPPLVTGDDLKREGFAPGPSFRVWLERVRDLQLNGEIAARDEAISRIREWAATGS
jgi:poly(A) polymerase